jgi:hypothetical protein
LLVNALAKYDEALNYAPKSAALQKSSRGGGEARGVRSFAAAVDDPIHKLLSGRGRLVRDVHHTAPLAIRIETPD